MARFSRPLGLTLLFLILLAATLVAAPPTTPRPVYDPGGNGPDGLLLLREWLREMGYGVGVTGQTAFDPTGSDLLFVYPGAHPFSAAEGERLAEWVEAGGVLVLVAGEDRELWRRFAFETAIGGAAEALVQEQPLLPAASAVISGTSYARRLRLADDFPGVRLLGEEGGTGRPAVAVARRGAGWLWLLSEDFSLTNEKLTGQRSTAQIVPALLRSVPPGGQVIFDTYHLFGPAEEEAGINSLQEWAYTTPSGWAALFVLGLALLFLLLQGQRLGPALSTAAQGRRREAAEFVAAMAGLQRRAGVRDGVARHLRQRLKQRVGRPWRIPAELPDEEFLARLAGADPSISPERLERLRGWLAELSALPDEARLVALAQEMDGEPRGGEERLTGNSQFATRKTNGEVL